MRFLISPQCPAAPPCRLERSPQPVARAADLPSSVLRSAAGLLLLILHTFVHPLFSSCSPPPVLAGLGLYRSTIPTLRTIPTARDLQMFLVDFF